MPDDPNIPINSSEEEYKSKTAPYSRDIDEIARGPAGPTGPAGAIGATGTTGAAGTNGTDAPQVQAEYSSDGTNWHSTYNPLADTYIHFSYDGGSTWDGASIILIGAIGADGDAAPNLQVEYSIDDITYQNTPTSPTNYIRFSLDGGFTWQAGYEAKGTAGSDGTDAYNVLVQYSVTGSTWHTPYVPGTDKYIRFSVDNGSTWLVSDVFIGTDGANGTDGTDAFFYIAWADDNSGTGFTMTFNEAKDYVAMISTDTEIPSPNVSDFAGLWKFYAGTTGADGADAYSYVAYASAIDGTGFTMTNNNALDYMAILTTSVYLAAPVVGDFVGLWFKRRGDAGTNASYIELPSDVTVTARCAAIIEQPSGWTMNSGDQISNPLSTNPVDLVIYHNTDKEVIDVVIKSKTIDHQIRLIGAAAYSTFLDDDTKKYLCIKSFSETLTILGIYILFES